MSEKDRVRKIIQILKKEYPEAKISLRYSTPFELLVATMLSAQCTDERVNIVTKDLFARYNTPKSIAKLDPKDLEQIIYSTGFYKNKAKNIIASAKIIAEKFNGEVPSTMEELLKLPGVGRKTANVVLSHSFATPGIVVDTHVTRISNRLGLVSTKDPKKIEFELMKLVPKKDWVIFTHLFIAHGRKICKSRKPQCNECPLNKLCPSANFLNK